MNENSRNGNPPVAAFTPQNKKGKQTSSMKIKTSRMAGFTLVEIMIVVAIIGLLAAIAIPNFVKARATAQKNACINNLRQIDAANQQYALENNLGATERLPDFSDEEYKKYLGRGSEGAEVGVDIVCPGGGSYTQAATASDVPTCELYSEGHELTGNGGSGGTSGGGGS